jgi:hypothetical protein
LNKGLSEKKYEENKIWELADDSQVPLLLTCSLLLGKEKFSKILPSVSHIVVTTSLRGKTAFLYSMQ